MGTKTSENPCFYYNASQTHNLNRPKNTLPTFNAPQPEDQARLHMGVAPPFLKLITGREFKGAETCVCTMTRLGTLLMTSKR